MQKAIRAGVIVLSAWGGRSCDGRWAIGDTQSNHRLKFKIRTGVPSTTGDLPISSYPFYHTTSTLTPSGNVSPINAVNSPTAASPSLEGATRRRRIFRHVEFTFERIMEMISEGLSGLMCGSALTATSNSSSSTGLVARTRTTLSSTGWDIRQVRD